MRTYGALSFWPCDPNLYVSYFLSFTYKFCDFISYKRLTSMFVFDIIYYIILSWGTLNSIAVVNQTGMSSFNLNLTLNKILLSEDKLVTILAYTEVRDVYFKFWGLWINLIDFPMLNFLCWHNFSLIWKKYQEVQLFLISHFIISLYHFKTNFK